MGGGGCLGRWLDGLELWLGGRRAVGLEGVE